MDFYLLFTGANFRGMICKSFLFVGTPTFIIITVILVAELDMMRVWIRAEVDFIVGQEVLYLMAKSDLLEMTRLSLLH